MKKLMTLLIALVLTTTLSAQNKKGKKDMAKKVTTEMTEVLSLDQATSAKVYELQSEKFANIKAATKELKEDKEALKSKKKEINNAFKTKLNAVLGKDNIKKWAAHTKERRNKSKKK